MNDKFLSTKEVAEKFSVHPNTVLNLIKSGELKAIRVGDQYRIDPADLEHYIQLNKTIK